jgi:tetratricopeptide (TPR) repeat protein
MSVIAVTQELVDRDPANRDYSAALAHGHLLLARLEIDFGSNQAALPELEKVIAIHRSLIAQAPADTHWHEEFADDGFNMSQVLDALHNTEGALLWIRISISEAEQLLALQPDDMRRVADLGDYLYEEGAVLVNHHRPDEALKPLSRSLALENRVLEHDPNARLGLSYALLCQSALGQISEDHDQLDDAMAHYQAAADLADRYLANGTDDPEDHLIALQPHLDMGKLATRRGDLETARRELGRAQRTVEMLKSQGRMPNEAELEAELKRAWDAVKPR